MHVCYITSKIFLDKCRGRTGKIVRVVGVSLLSETFMFP